MAALFGNQVLDWLLLLTYGGVETLWALLSTSFLVSPDVTALPQVTAIMDTSLTVVNTCYGLAVVVAGLTVMTHGTLQIRYTVGDLLPRLVIGFIAANFARPLCSGVVEFANALTQGLTGDTVASSGSFVYMLTVIGGAGRNAGGNGILLIVIGLLLAVLTGMLICAWYIRLGVLIALVAIAPAALACHGLPHTEAVAALWWRAMLGCLGVVTVQAFALHSTLAIFLNPDVNQPALGLPTDPMSLANLLIVVCMLWITIKIPGLTRRLVTTGGRGHNPVGLVLRMMVIQAASRALRLPIRGGRAAAAGRAARASAATTRAGGYRPTINNAVISYWRPRTPRPIGARAATGPATGGAPSTGTTGPRSVTSTGRPVVPAGVTPATAVPKTRPAWQTATTSPVPRPVTATQPVPPPRRVPPGINPATAIPPRRPPRRT
ncbi:MAG: hypothetical protein HKP61_23275 [Dactylosporangium sp.]|nr:hypothetical protein [Dactylosporangium sp.]NNJ63801.1 hypothetical protein [Dactylosporangium sp.]